MLNRQILFRVTNLFKFSIRSFSYVPSNPPKTCYYKVLGLTSDATDEQIKNAYRKLAKKYHPDVNLSGKTHEPSAEKFREIAEAYAVLSIQESKMDYDISHQKQESAELAKVKSETMAKNRKMRDRSGHVPSPTPMRGSYAEYRIKQLAKEREKYNVNFLGYYDGGLPQKKSGAQRRGALNHPGAFHSPIRHNELERMERDGQRIDHLDTQQFSALQSLEQSHGRDRPRPYHPIDADPEMRYFKNREFSTAIIFGIFGFILAKKIYYREKYRMHMNERLPENLINAPAHHFVNRGGVLIKKEVVGFAKYFNNDKETLAWYRKVYPEIMNAKEEAPAS
ncbi:unnamed protein product [Moneuplotes crassus]|uniref:J domain-containing protein n=2 Tax=Euplotes crassus TaxID=5936 RepID=A0AAD1XJ71_EUPCR|nr:unnamed protein product [Moneuplotes crassus]